MNETELTQMADFLNIAIEQIDRRNKEVAADFVEDVRDAFRRSGRDGVADKLDTAVEDIVEEEYRNALDTVEDVYEGLLEELTVLDE